MVCSSALLISFGSATDLSRRHTFSNKEKAAYIDAELCLMKKPAVHNLPGAQTRFDEFQAIHQLQSYATHFVGAFLPFHRAMLFAHEEAMRKECGYQGRQPFWQEQLDAGHFNTSVVFDAEFGFGGNGSAPSKCITDGPFKDYTLHLGPNYNYTDWCITRNVNDNISSTTAQDFVDECLEKPDWLSHWPCVETNPHLGGHGGVGELVRILMGNYQ